MRDIRDNHVEEYRDLWQSSYQGRRRSLDKILRSKGEPRCGRRRITELLEETEEVLDNLMLKPPVELVQAGR